MPDKRLRTDLDNPFQFGPVVRGASFTDRTDEVAALVTALRSGQDVTITAPRRYGKSSLIRRVAAELRDDGVLVAYCDLFFTPSKEKLAQHLARTLYDDVASPTERAMRGLDYFRRLRIAPRIEVDSGGSVVFGFAATSQPADIDDTIEGLLRLPGEIAERRDRQVVLILDEFQEVLELDPDFPKLFRTVFQDQGRVGHAYLGSRRHLMRRLFADENEPFFRSARHFELGPIPLNWFAGFIRKRFADTERSIEDEALVRLLALTQGHPYQTQQLAHFAWALTARAAAATPALVDEALAQVVDSEHTYFTQVWAPLTRNKQLVLIALAHEPGAVYSRDYQTRFGLPGASTTQNAVRALSADELIAQDPGSGTRPYRLADPFLRAWLRRAEALDPAALSEAELAEARAAISEPRGAPA